MYENIHRLEGLRQQQNLLTTVDGSVCVKNGDTKSTLEPHSKRKFTGDGFSGDGSKSLFSKMKNAQNFDHEENEENSFGDGGNTLPAHEGRVVAVGLVRVVL